MCSGVLNPGAQMIATGAPFGPTSLAFIATQRNVIDPKSTVRHILRYPRML